MYGCSRNVLALELHRMMLLLMFDDRMPAVVTALVVDLTALALSLTTYCCSLDGMSSYLVRKEEKRKCQSVCPVVSVVDDARAAAGQRKAVMVVGRIGQND